MIEFDVSFLLSDDPLDNPGVRQAVADSMGEYLSRSGNTGPCRVLVTVMSREDPALIGSAASDWFDPANCLVNEPEATLSSPGDQLGPATAS